MKSLLGAGVVVVVEAVEAAVAAPAGVVVEEVVESRLKEIEN